MSCGSLPLYTFRRGETITLPLDITGGTTADVSAVEAWLRYSPYRPSCVDESMTKVAEFEVSEQDGGVGYLFTLQSGVSDTLEDGYYVADARLTIAGGIVITTPVAIRILEPVTTL